MDNNVDYLWLEGNQALSEMCQGFSLKKWLVLDTEFIRETTYFAIPGLLQFSDGDNNWLLDPLTVSDWSPLRNLLDSDLLWVMHACSEDIEVLHNLTGSTPKHLFDTQVAAQFADLGQGLGYQKLILELHDLLLDKGESRTNWLRRPLSSKQLSYAANDVHYLALVWQQLQKTIDEKGFTEMFLEDMAVITHWQPVDCEFIYQKVKLAWQLDDANQINRLQALASWREQRAQQKDKPKRHILSDETLLEFARVNPATVDEIKYENLLRSHQIKALAQPLLKLLEDVEQQQASYPAVRRSIEMPGSKAVLKKWKTLAEKIAEENHIPKFVLYSNGLLEAFFKYHHGLVSAPHKMWIEWRKNLLLEPFLSILEKQDVLQSAASKS